MLQLVEFIKTFYRAIKYVYFECDWIGRDTWPQKSYFAIDATYYDGYWASINIYKLYIGWVPRLPECQN